MIQPQVVTPSGRKTADTAICAIPCKLHGVVLENDGTNASSIIVYDNASAASGTVLVKVLLPASSTTLSLPVLFNNPIAAQNGIYVDVTGTGAAYTVYFSPGL